MRQPLVLDANLTLLLVVGITNREYIKKHKRLEAYDEKDFDILLGIISSFPELIFTPNVLTETSNLVRYIGEPRRSEISNTLKKVIQRSKEYFVESNIAVSKSEYLRLGLTDSVLLEVAKAAGVLLTADLDLYLAAVTAKLSAQNYAHIQNERYK